MDTSAKETVIIVHGTWAALDPKRKQWYDRIDGDAVSRGFVAKLNDELEKRGSQARCWSHCTEGDQIFQWTGKNSWLDRTQAAAELGNSVAELQSRGWCCHIVAHSHGGNVVVEALPQITPVAGSTGSLGKIVTLGTPFMDTMAPITKRARHIHTFQKALFWLAIIFVIWIVANLMMATKGPNEDPFGMTPDFIFNSYPPLADQIKILAAISVLQGCSISIGSLRAETGLPRRLQIVAVKRDHASLRSAVRWMRLGKFCTTYGGLIIR
jgi:hypothetical protein